VSRPQLATYVHVADENDTMHVFGPDDDMSKPENQWAVGKIVNPKAWVGGKAPDAGESPDEERARLLARLAELDNAGKQADAGSRSTGDGQAEGDGPPPKGGDGSGAPAWREYAARNGVEVPADASRADIIAALERAQVRTE
jgi:hypothetical protein